MKHNKHKRVINKNKYPNLHHLNKIQENKNIDDIAKTFLSIISAHGLTLDEVASLNYFIMKTSLETKSNKEFMEKHFNIDTTKLGPEGIFQVQRALLSSYYEKIK